MFRSDVHTAFKKIREGQGSATRTAHRIGGPPARLKSENQTHKKSYLRKYLTNIIIQG